MSIQEKQTIHTQLQSVIFGYGGMEKGNQSAAPLLPR